jgi:prolyl oligopeptidase
LRIESNINAEVAGGKKDYKSIIKGKNNQMLKEFMCYSIKERQILSNILFLTITIPLSIFLFSCHENDMPPNTRQDNVKEVLHGIEIIDPYRWLEDQNSSETRKWIENQNNYSTGLLANYPARAAIKTRLKEMLNVDQTGSLIIRGDRYFIWKKEATQELWSVYLRKGLNGTDEVLLDPAQLSTDNSMSFSVEDVSSDGKLILFGIRKGGEDEREIRLMDVDSKTDLPDQLPRSRYSNFALKKDKTGFYYSIEDRVIGPRTYYHKMGTDPSKDIYLFGEGLTSDKGIGVLLSSDDRYLIILVYHGWAKTEIYLKDIKKDTPIIPVIKNVDANFFPEYADDRLYLHTNWKAPKGRIVSVDLKHPAVDNWKEIVSEKTDAIQNFSLISGNLYVHYLHNVVSRIVIYTTDGKENGDVPLPGLGSIRGPWGDWEGDNVFLEFRSYVQPRVLYQFNQKSDESKLWANSDMNFNPEKFEVKQVWYPSKDGTKIPMFLVHKKDLEPDGNNPTLLYGYGGFNQSLTPRFDTMAALLIEQGGIYAVANIRGGGEFGEAWHKAGMLENKQTVFDDFIRAAEWLIEYQYTSSSRLAIIGYSNGGLLVGSCLTQRPDLYQAVLCLFPDLDMIGYYRFENNNPPALAEYGDASNPEHFKFLMKYSPYQHIKSGIDYPAVLLATGDTDTRVPPLQARKMTARLQSATSSDRPIVLMYDTKAGHSGGKPQSKQIEDLSMKLAFLFWQLDMEYK